MIFVLFFYIHFFLLCIFVSSSNQLAHIMEIYINVILITFTATHTIFITMITIMRITSPQAVRSKNTFLKANAPVGLIRPKIVNSVQNNKKNDLKQPTIIIFIIAGNQSCRTCPSSSLYSDATHKICPRSGRKISCTKNHCHK